MNNMTAEAVRDGIGQGNISYVSTCGTTPSDVMGGVQEEKLVPSHMSTMGVEMDKDVRLIISPATGEVDKMVVSITKRVVEILESAINLLDEVVEVYDNEIERINIFSLFGEKIKSLWELREETNQNFVDVLVLLEVAVRNSHYQNYQKNQYQSVKIVLEKIKVVHITSQQTKECRKLLMDNGIDLFAPIRDWEAYTVEIKKNDGAE